MKKKFKVVKIINDTSLIVNGGSNDNVEVNDIMKIQGKSESIFDPDTKENLGKLDVIKDSLKVTKVYEKMCLCETAYVSTYFSALMTSPLFSSTQRKMDVEPTDISGTGDKTIRVGDDAILVKNKSQQIIDKKKNISSENIKNK